MRIFGQNTKNSPVNPVGLLTTTRVRRVEWRGLVGRYFCLRTKTDGECTTIVKPREKSRFQARAFITTRRTETNDREKRQRRGKNDTDVEKTTTLGGRDRQITRGGRDTTDCDNADETRGKDDVRLKACGQESVLECIALNDSTSSLRQRAYATNAFPFSGAGPAVAAAAAAAAAAVVWQRAMRPREVLRHGSADIVRVTSVLYNDDRLLPLLLTIVIIVYYYYY